MSEYMTEQRRKLLDFFKNHPDKRFTAKQVAESLKKSDISISAIYRNLSKLEQDGYLSRTVRQGSSESCYQSLFSECCRECIHLSCIKCGNTFHMDHDVSAALMEGVSRQDGFKISRAKTVLYGICSRCDGGLVHEER